MFYNNRQNKEKKKVQVIKFSRQLPISSFGSRHCRQEGCGVHERRAYAHDRGTCARAQVCLGRPVATGFLGCSVATEMVHSMSRQRL